MSSLSLEHIFALPKPFIESVIINNGFSLSGDFYTDRLIVTILLTNGGMLLESDKEFVKHPRFNELYIKPDQEIINEVIQKRITNINPTANRFDYIRRLIDIPKLSTQHIQSPLRISQLSPRPRSPLRSLSPINGNSLSYVQPVYSQPAERDQPIDETKTYANLELGPDYTPSNSLSVSKNEGTTYYSYLDNADIAIVKGSRSYMEDYYSMASYDLNLNDNNKRIFLYAVYDGHGGSQTSMRSSKELAGYIFKAIQDIANSGQNLKDKSILETKFKSTIEEFEETLIPNAGSSGSTMTMVVDMGDYYYFINSGDSRSILIRNGSLVFTTKDHEPDDPDEKQRIFDLGGSVYYGRVQGTLAVSRSLGDFSYNKIDGTKYTPDQAYVPATPDVDVINKQPNDIIVLASDGIWAKHSHGEYQYGLTNDMVIERINDNKSSIDIVRDSLSTGMKDNVTIIIVKNPITTSTIANKLINSIN